MRLRIYEEVKMALEGSEQLQYLSNGRTPSEVRVYSGRASRDPKMPYIVYAVLLRFSADIVDTAYLIVDIWDFDNDSLRIELMAAEVRKLFHRKRITNSSIRFILHTDDVIRDFTRNNGSIRNNQESVHQISVQFNVRGCDEITLAEIAADNRRRYTSTP